jgi:hypothetical protein
MSAVGVGPCLSHALACLPGGSGGGYKLDYGDNRLNTQSEFDFDYPTHELGYTRWVAGRRLAAQELARRMNLPIGHKVEVWLYGGVRLRGQLRLRENVLLVEEERVRHMELMVDHVPFTYREMESCVRLD